LRKKISRATGLSKGGWKEGKKWKMNEKYKSWLYFLSFFVFASAKKKRKKRGRSQEEQQNFEFGGGDRMKGDVEGGKGYYERLLPLEVTPAPKEKKRRKKTDGGEREDGSPRGHRIWQYALRGEKKKKTRRRPAEIRKRERKGRKKEKGGGKCAHRDLYDFSAVRYVWGKIGMARRKKKKPAKADCRNECKKKKKDGIPSIYFDDFELILGGKRKGKVKKMATVGIWGKKKKSVFDLVTPGRGGQEKKKRK